MPVGYFKVSLLHILQILANVVGHSYSMITEHFHTVHCQILQYILQQKQYVSMLLQP